MTLIDILLVVLIIAAILLSIYLIFSLRKLNDTVELLKNDMHDLHEKTLPLIENLTEITDRATKITSEAENYWQDITSSVESVRNKITTFGRSHEGSTTGNPIEDFVRNLRAITKGVAAFWSNFKR